MIVIGVLSVFVLLILLIAFVVDLKNIKIESVAYELHQEQLIVDLGVELEVLNHAEDKVKQLNNLKSRVQRHTASFMEVEYQLGRAKKVFEDQERVVEKIKKEIA